ncbi:MAG: GAF domain-containing protein [Pleurocapsa sp. MO_226.B13]|nr:GAF domain-containing protein [Pleurocapsa sp. MO_226.B13]
MTSLFNSANINTNFRNSENGYKEKSYIDRQEVKTELQSLAKDLDQLDFKESKPLRERIERVIKLSTTVEEQERLESEKIRAIAEKLRLAEDNATLLDTTVREVKQLLNADRVLLYAFSSDSNGVVVAEVVREGFTPARGEKLPSLCFGLSNAKSYQRAKIVAIADVKQADLSPYQLQLAERFQVSSSLALPVLLPKRVWGLMVVQQCWKPRPWQDSELRLLEEVCTELGVQLQVEQVREQLQGQLKTQKALAKVLDKLRKPFNLQTLFEVATQEVRKLLGIERVTIYKFREDYFGDFIAEAELPGFPKLVGSGWEDPYLNENRGGRFRDDEALVCNDIYNADLSECHIEALEFFGVKSCAVVSIFKDRELWGLLSAFQNTSTRDWLESEVELLRRVAAQIGIALSQAEILEEIQDRNLKLDRLARQEQSLNKVFNKINQSLDLDALFKSVSQEVRKLLGIERVVIYQFHDHYLGGDFIAESELAGFPKLVGSGWEDSYLQEHQGGRFRYDTNASYVCDDVHQGSLSECHLEVLESFGVRSFAVVGLFKEQKLWGLLAGFQNTSAHHWSDSEVELLKRVAAQIGIALNQAENLEQLEARNTDLDTLARQEQTLSRVVDKIRSSLDLETIFQTATQEVRKLLEIERVTIYKFNEEYFGEFVGEAELPGYPKFIGQNWDDPYLNENQGGRFQNDEALVCNDIYNAGLTDCHIEALEYYGLKSCAVVSIFKGQELWGLLSAFQNTGPRNWSESELQLLKRVAAQIGIALKQAETFEQVQTKNAQLARIAEREQFLTRIIENIRKPLNVETNFRTTTKELRSILNCDRVAIYQFNPDWSGHFIAESYGRGWESLMEKQKIIPNLQESLSDCQGIKSMNKDSLRFSDDTFLQETQGGRFRDRQLVTRDDIYQAGFTPCYLEVLEEYQAKAYAIAPIFLGEKLWGLLAAFQNTGPRHWETGELNVLSQIATQLGVALQQGQYVKELQQQSEQISQLAEQGVGFAKLIYQIGQQSPAQLQDGFSIKSLLRLATSETRRLFNTDRVAIYHFNLDWSGKFIVEDVGRDWNPLVGSILEEVKDTYLQENQGGRYAQNESLRVDNIYTQGYQDCHIQLLEQFQAKAYMIAPIFNGERLWGLLAVYHNQEPRSWNDNELRLLTQVASQLGVVIQRMDDLQKLARQQRKLAEAAEREKTDKERLQRETLSLLRTIEPSLQGDLTVKVPLWEDEIGTIADGYNTTLQTLRELVRQVKSSAEKVDQTCNNSTLAVGQLSDRAEQQSQQLKQALKELEQMVESIAQVTENAQQVDRAVLNANQTVRVGDSVMEETVAGIAEIRETVSETAKKLKNLGESSQKIAKVVSLIDNFANQTNLLAINAAIEATRAGEYGRGFAVVADEIRTLAYQSANATTEIERLVQEIRSETQSVTEAMELGIMRVIKGTELVNKTRQSLDEIKSATNQISDRVQQITASTSTQTEQSQLMTKAMTDVASVADQTSENSVKIASLFEELQATSEQLQTSISKFKID